MASNDGSIAKHKTHIEKSHGLGGVEPERSFFLGQACQNGMKLTARYCCGGFRPSMGVFRSLNRFLRDGIMLIGSSNVKV